MATNDYQKIEENPVVLENILNIFYILRNSTRFKILLLLLNAEMSVGQLVETTGISQSAISHQLSKMKRHKIIKSRKEGKHQYYCLYDNHVEMLIQMAMTHALEE